MAKLKVALTILAALALGGTIGTTPAESPRGSMASMVSPAPPRAAAGRAPFGSSTASSSVASRTGVAIVHPPASRPSQVPPACPLTLGTAAAQASPCQPCPVVVVNPTGLCPPNVPPPAARPVISFCPQPPIVLRPVPGTIELHGLLCGRGFRRSETVTITATSLHGTYSWQVISSSSGSFISPVPTFLCRLAPLMLVAKGSSGDRSNGLSLSASCQVTL
jgi:hypothetical protein